MLCLKLRYGKINVYEKIVTRKKEKRENMEVEEIYTYIFI